MRLARPPSLAHVRCWMRTCECPHLHALQLLVVPLLLLRMPWHLLQQTGDPGKEQWGNREGGGGRFRLFMLLS
jgi:hypothetical protein